MKQVANHKFEACPRCQRTLVPAKSINGAPSEFWLRCSDAVCRTFVITYIPQPHQAEFHADNHRITANFGGYGSGKEEDKNNIIPTPTGYRRFGDLKVGDWVFGSDGQPTEVKGAFDQGVKPVYEVTFRGGAKAYVGAEHLWTIKQAKHPSRRRTVTTLELGRGATVQLMSAPAAFQTEMPAYDPYVTGVFIGDGCCRSKFLELSSENAQIPEFVAQRLGATAQSNSHNAAWLFKRGALLKTADVLHPELVGKYAHEKHIPKEYLTAPTTARLELLQGLMDTDGSVYSRSDAKGVRYSYWTNSSQLRDDFVELARSLGCYTSVYEDYRQAKVGYNIHLSVPSRLRDSVFQLPRKQERSVPGEKNIRGLTVQEVKYSHDAECMCIAVAATDQLYITRDYIVTHNTTTSRMELEKHILITEGGTSLVGANVTSQYEQTLQREFNADFPAELVDYYNNQKSYADFENGHRLIYRPYDDPNKLRSYNLTSWLILEASEVKQESYTQLKTRLRNTAACTFKRDEKGDIVYSKGLHGQLVPVIDKDWRRGIIESNPAAGWIKTEVLNCSDVIRKHGDIHDVYTLDKDEQDHMLSTHVTATTANAYLPPDFIDMQTKNRPRWWVERYIYGSFLYADGLVYPSATKYITDAFDPPKAWRRIMAFDYGLADSSCFLFGSVDMMNNLLYFYKEVYVNNRNVEELANLFKEAAADIPVGNWICSPIIDPKSGPRRDYDKKTLADNFLDYGISFMPGQVNREARVFRLNTYLESGRVRIMSSCPNLIRQFKELKFKQNPISTTSPWRNDPEDKDDHAVVCAEWIVMELPKDPKNLIYGVYGKDGNMINMLYSASEQRSMMDDHYGYHVFDEESDNSYDNNALYFEREGFYDSLN